MDSQINSVVSGALDRLHYETDPCVKYDSEKRLWIYLHKNRQIDDPLWNASEGQEEPNTTGNNGLKPKYFFENNLPAYESDEEVQMLRKRMSEKDDIKEGVELSNSQLQKPVDQGYKRDHYEAGEFNDFQTDSFKEPRLQ